jgi:hypothetical protein
MLSNPLFSAAVGVRAKKVHFETFDGLDRGAQRGGPTNADANSPGSSA